MPAQKKVSATKRAPKRKSVSAKKQPMKQTKTELCKGVDSNSAAEYVKKLSNKELCSIFTKTGLKTLAAQQEAKKEKRQKFAESAEKKMKEIAAKQPEVFKRWREYATLLSGKHLKLTPYEVQYILDLKNVPRSGPSAWLDLRNMRHKTDYAKTELNSDFGQFRKEEGFKNRITMADLKKFKEDVKTLKQLDEYLKKAKRYAVEFE